MEIAFKGVFMKGGDVYGLSVRLLQDNKVEAETHVALPTTLTPAEAAQKLRELASWIDQESK